MTVRAFGAQLSVASIEPIQEQEILAVRLERRQKFVEREAALTAVDEATRGLIAVGLKHEDDPARRAGRRAAGRTRQHGFEQWQRNAHPRCTAQQRTPTELLAHGASGLRTGK